MKIISSNLASHISSEVMTLATCWKLSRRDGTIMGFTDHNENIIYNSVTYLASSGFTPSAVANNSELAVDNMDIEGVIDSFAIKEEDIKAGLYDYAQIEVFMVNYNDLTQGDINLRTGWLGEMKFSKNRFAIEVRGLMQSLTQGIGQLYSPSCRAELGDLRCGVNLTGYTVTGSVTSATNNQIFSDSTRAEDDAYFDFGKITFTSGLNNGLSMEVKEFRDKIITLVLPLPYTIVVSDTYSLIAGCDKNLNTCISKFSNAANFRGEPHVPGIDKMLETAGTKNN
ncbi:MAG: DUF2163 domain-containing protein [Rickettsiales bacterium]|nr:DUF2163 domain-containing protein [Pseudomonadota bacterium]MDA0966649.1 DUF2163 domain-containing protein [Pseudomonadota bacterium]MDG4543677.1 DUF2163 domain-containing protein [Rickettsiales bacterium]MDG4545824.1 DUF2163 domain-containing protein [Rickettsiales bacterium]MDG4547402.1 DUF2163 domain-containing protein [Rickettsiales bacterium]